MIKQWWRIGGALGIAYVVLFIVGIIGVQGETPGLTAPVDEIREYFDDSGQQYMVGDYLGGIAFVLFLLPFISILSSFLGEAEGRPAVFSRIVLVGGVVLVTLGGAGSIPWGAMALGAAADPEVDDSIIRAFMYMGSYAFSFLPIAGALMLLPASLVILKTGALWRWLAYAGFVISLLAVVSGIWVIDGDEGGPLAILGFLSIMGMNLWVLAAGIALVRTKELPGATA